MTSRYECLPSVPDAVDAIHRFADLDPASISDHSALASKLGGMSAALSAVALDYGGNHPVPDIETNIGLWTEIGADEDRHKFTVTPQDIFGLGGAHIWRSATVGGTDRYYDSVVVPTEGVLQEFQDANPDTLQQGWHQPSWTDIYATRIRTPDDVEAVRQYQAHWPFHRPTSRPESYPNTAEADAIGYSTILRDLSKTLLEVVR